MKTYSFKALAICLAIIPCVQVKAQNWEEKEERDSTVLIINDAQLNYLFNSDSVIQASIENRWPVIYPSLAVNGVVISDRNEIELIRKCLHITGVRLKFDFERLWRYEVVYQLGPYKVRKHKYVDAYIAEKRGFRNVSKDGLNIICLKRKEIFDISVLESRITDEENRNAQSSANTP